MSAQPARRALAMTLNQLVDRYRELAGEFGTPVPLSGFALAAPETERLFSSFDEDYHISRFFHFSEDLGAGAVRYTIDGQPATHISLDAEIQSLL